MAVIFYFHAWKLSDTSTPKGVTECEAATRAKRSSETGRKRRGEKKKETEVESRVLQRDTPFLDRLGFGGGTGRRGSCACVRVPLWSFRKDKPKKQTKKPKRKHRGATFERSRTDTVDNEKASEEQFINDKPVSSDAQQ